MIHLAIPWRVSMDSSNWSGYTICERDANTVRFKGNYDIGDLLDVDCPDCKKSWDYIEAMLESDGESRAAYTLRSNKDEDHRVGYTR